MRALLLLALLGCKDKQWIDLRAKKIHVGTLEADIPEGWRDINEFADKSRLRGQPPRDGSRVLLHENIQEPGEILVFKLNVPPGKVDCTSLVAVMQSQTAGRWSFSDVQNASFAGNPGCMMNTNVEELSGYLRIVAVAGADSIGVRCLGWARDMNWACDKVVYGLHLTPH